MNKAILIGNLGRDPEISYTPSGMAVAKFSIATSEKWKDKNTGEMQEHTEWHRITTFGRLAEICEKYLYKGKQVCIEGRIKTSSWEKDGITRYTTGIIASTMKMLGARVPEGDYNLPKTSETSEDSWPSQPENQEGDIPY
ncbi:single-stranded DNA-binding protein [Thermodesulfobacteriota bacterium]